MVTLRSMFMLLMLPSSVHAGPFHGFRLRGLPAEGLRDYVSRLVYVMIFLTGSANIADILTKPQAVSVFVELMAAYDAYVCP